VWSALGGDLAGLDAALRKPYYTNRLLNYMVSYDRPDRLSLTLAALADPTRRAILAQLASGERSVSEIAQPFGMTLPGVSKHLKVLERAGLIARRRDAQRRPCRLEARPLRDVAEWAQQYRKFWDARLDRLDDYLAKMQSDDSGVSNDD
jgi:DNA-binding transcriptional ArsR family regulator